MSVNELEPAPRPARRLRAVFYATTLLAGGGLIGAVLVGPTLGQGFGRGGDGAESDGPRWHRFMDRQDQEDGPGWRRGGHRFGRHNDDDGPGMGGHMGAHMGRGFGGMMYPGAIERRVNRVLGIVDASTEQKQKVRAIFEKAANDLYGMRDQRVQNRRAMTEALAAATIDRAKVDQLRGERMKLADATSKRLTDALVEAAEVLTPAQRADLAARFQRRGG
jgi:periplasmic protein CpxP/Spy